MQLTNKQQNFHSILYEFCVHSFFFHHCHPACIFNVHRTETEFFVKNDVPICFSSSSSFYFYFQRNRLKFTVSILLLLNFTFYIFNIPSLCCTKQDISILKFRTKTSNNLFSITKLETGIIYTFRCWQNLHM